MSRILTMLILLPFLTLITSAQNCNYWLHKVDSAVVIDDSQEVDEHDEKNVLFGMKCLLGQQGNRREGLVFRDENDVSQILPVPTVEVSALYYISLLFFGDHSFGRAVALIGDPYKLEDESGMLQFNSSSDIRKAYSSYRKWFKSVETLGLKESRRQKLNPLAQAGVRWY